eukprot:s3627_g12.t1
MKASAEYPWLGESEEGFINRCMRGHRGAPDAIPAYMDRVKRVYAIATFREEQPQERKEEDRRGPAGPGDPGYEPFPKAG